MATNSFVRRVRAVIVLGLVGGAIALAVGAAPASAGLGLACPSPTSVPFTGWRDYSNYAFSPDGGFEGGGSGWSLTGGARVVSGNESFYLHNSADKLSLSLPAGASATSPPMCISLFSSKMRFLSRGSFGSKIKAGKLDDILSQASTKREPVYVPEGRFYLQPYPKDAVAKASKVYSGAVLEGMQSGVVALYQKYSHDVPMPRGWMALQMSIITFGCLNLVCLGIMGEYVGRIYEQSKDRPLFLIREQVNLDDPHARSASSG